MVKHVVTLRTFAEFEFAAWSFHLHPESRPKALHSLYTVFARLKMNRKLDIKLKWY